MRVRLRLLALEVGDDVAVALQHILVAGQALEPDRPAAVQTVGADPDFRTKTVTEAVGETRRGVVHDGRKREPSIRRSGLRRLNARKPDTNTILAHKARLDLAHKARLDAVNLDVRFWPRLCKN